MTTRIKRIRRTPEEARRLILEAAQARIASTGPDGLRLQDIAADAGLSHPTILHHFGNREGLVRELVLVLKQQTLRETLRQRNLEATERYFSWDRIADAYLTFLRMS